QKTTRIISSHILSELSKFATSYLFIDKGQLLEKISATSLENSSHHRYIISTNDNKKARQLRLDKGYSVTETSDALDIYNVNDQTEFLNLLIQNQFLLTRFESKENGLEDHFLRLIGDRK
ncbi:MAG: ABC transporter ATP-binding protein, partial [Mollicutes bacterium]|nr:ABC transporter ATP-binding protein [Mollicutes bacterium]